MSSSKHNRVLMLLENCSFPQDVRVFPEACALVSHGYQVSVICPAHSGESWREIVNGVHVFRYPGPPAIGSSLGYIWEYGYSLIATWMISLRVFIRPGFDVIHAGNPPDTAVFIAAFYRVFGKRFIFDHHDLAPELYLTRFGTKNHKFIYQMLIWLEQFSCRLADHVIATNQSYKALEIQRGKIPESRITIVRNGPTRDFIKFSKPDPSLRTQDRSMITYVGRMQYQDGVDCLIRALYHLVNDFHRTDFHCTLVGAGEALSMLQNMAEEMHIKDYLSFTGWVNQSEVPHYISAGDICVAPEPSNPLNDHSTMIKITEYMALGKPIVAFDLPEHRASAQAAALYALPNDELDFARQITVLMEDAERRAKMGQYGFDRVEKELAWSHQETKLIEVYEKLLSDEQG
jgi:glycosyltransferase involved in cell wall biosynthesis